MTPVLTVSAEQVTELVSRARENGTVALADLNAAFDRCELMPEVIDDVMRMLADDGVEIVDAGSDEPDEARRGDEPDRARRSGTSDLVRIYLREIGKVPLLTAQDEVELAKAIEAGLFAREMLHGGCKVVGAGANGAELAMIIDLGDHQGDRRPGPHDQDPRAHGRDDQQDGQDPAAAASGSRPRAHAGRGGRGDGYTGRPGGRDPADRARTGLAPGADRRGGLGPR